MNRKRWKPLSVAQTADIMDGLATNWWVAGGWAIDLFLGRQTRHHADTDVLVLYRDQAEVWRHRQDARAAEAHKTRHPVELIKASDD
jgi:hypothetical protein